MFSKFMKHTDARVITVPSNQFAELEFCNLIGSKNCHGKFQEAQCVFCGYQFHMVTSPSNSNPNLPDL